MVKMQGMLQHNHCFQPLSNLLWFVATASPSMASPLPVDVARLTGSEVPSFREKGWTKCLLKDGQNFCHNLFFFSLLVPLLL
ncbi:hypothetical protein CUMW_238430 [Citrus unshiu]|uniref:Secreted protein n=1 Tax=Citrus unshiu TaxID=55188 RepID=A0A2H5QLE6_CITUN|nr:hypothetical protein CUMW_238430 [Citrus unshiu]